MDVNAGYDPLSSAIAGTQTVAAVVVTFNRKHLLVECLDALLAQTKTLDRIVVIDNASTDGTSDLLDEHRFLSNPKIDYIRLPENIGGAGGFYEGMKRAYESGYDWLWVMDDDAEPLPDALEILADEFNNTEAVAVAGVLLDTAGNKQLGHRGWMIRDTVTFAATRQLTEPDLSADCDIEFASFVGLCISRKVISIIGLPKAEMFIHHDDLEYCDRISKIRSFRLKVGSKIIHKYQQMAEANEVLVFGKRSSRVDYTKFWLHFYGHRNKIWWSRQNFSAWAVFRLYWFWYLRKALAVLIYDDHKFRRFLMVTFAFLDGWRGVFDNDRPKRILYGRNYRS